MDQNNFIEIIKKHQLDIANELFSALINFAQKPNSTQLTYDLIYKLDDIRSILYSEISGNSKFSLETKHPLASESQDHINPRGTKDDNTRSPRFVFACEQHFKKQIKFMDLGCSGGGLVFDFLKRGHDAIGLEGSDYSKKSLRAEWRVIPNHLFTCDITKPFQVKLDNEITNFDIITMWEVLEHLNEENLLTLFENVKRHLDPNDGLLVGSIALRDDVVNGISYHPTVKPIKWWNDIFLKYGFKFIKGPFIFDDFCRGTGNGPFDSNFKKDPDAGFHFVACLIEY